MVTVKPGEGVFQDSKGNILVRRDGKFVKVTTPIKVVRPGFSSGGRRRISGRPPGESASQRRAREAAVATAEAAAQAEAKAKADKIIADAKALRQSQERARIQAEAQAAKAQQIQIAQIQQQKITEVTPGVFRIRDPKTGKLVLTSSLEFAQSIERVGREEALRISKAEGGGRSGRSKQRLQDELSRIIAEKQLADELARKKAIEGTGEVQPVTTTLFDNILGLPRKTFEALIGRTPREAFRFVTGAKETDITKPLTLSEIIVETTKVPQKAIMDIGGAFAGKGTGLLFPEEGFDIKLAAKPEKEFTFIEQQFGTIITDPVTGKPQTLERMITIPTIGERTVKIFERERVEQGAGFGFGLGATIVAPLLFAPGFVAGGTRTALDPEETTLNRILGGVEAGTGAFILGAKGVQFLRTPVVKRIPLREVKTPEAIEVQKLIQLRGKQTTATVFDITGELSAPAIIQRTTRGKQIIDILGKQLEKVVRVGGKPVISLRARGKLEFIPARTFSIRTPEVIIGKQPFLVSEVREGSRIARLSQIVGTEGRISLKGFKELPRLEKFLLQSGAELLTGRKVPLSQVPKILSIQKQRFSSLIETEKLFKIRPGKTFSEFELIPRGRRIQRFIAVSEAEKLATTDTLELLKVKTLFKDVTFPFARATGKTPTLDTLILKMKPSRGIDDTIKFIKPAKITKTPFSKTFQQQEEVVQSLASKVILPTPKSTGPTTTILKTPTEKVFPSIVGGIGGVEAESIFAGEGAFETTEPSITGRVRPLMIDKQIPSLRIETLSFQAIEPIQRGRVRQIQKPVQLELSKLLESQKPIEVQKSIQTQKSIQLEKSIQAQKQTLQLLGISSLGITGRLPPTPPPVPPPIVPSLFALRRKRLQERIKEVELFTVEIKERGIFRPLGGDLTLSGALGLGARRTRQTLARTFRVIPTGKRKKIKIDEDFGEPDLTGFRRFKIRRGKRIATPFTFIQEKELALGSRSERRLLQQSRQQSLKLNEILNM